jgi:ABC-type Fe3+ transport system permease subunit
MKQQPIPYTGVDFGRRRTINLRTAGEKGTTMNEVPAIITACTNCLAPASLVATFAVVLVGVVIAAYSERRNQRLTDIS